jgi:hypothetical protein
LSREYGTNQRFRENGVVGREGMRETPQKMELERFWREKLRVKGVRAFSFYGNWIKKRDHPVSLDRGCRQALQQEGAEEEGGRLSPFVKPWTRRDGDP